MVTSTPIYLMNPKLFTELSYVDNFNIMNGVLYQDYINNQLINITTKEQKDMIRSTHQPQDVLVLLDKMNISYSHVWEETLS
tara:strand:- start:2734 stop:2979 length:246 start_codon:yes stop_codon:yes gene_type:complete